MVIQLTICNHCLEEHPDIRQTIEQLQAELGDHLHVVSLTCMAACDSSPAAMIDYDYFPRLCPHALRAHVLDRVINSHEDKHAQ